MASSSEYGILKFFNERAFALFFLDEQDSRQSLLLKEDVSPQHVLDKILRSSMENQDHELALKALEKGANPNAVGSYSNTPLNIAFQNGDLAGIDLLISKGARLDACEYPAIISAVISTSLDVVKKAIALGADVHHDNYCENKAMHMAAALPQALPILKYFVESLYCDVNTPGMEYRTPLFHAVYQNNNIPPNVEGVKYLLEKNAKTDRRTNKKETVYSYAKRIAQSRRNYSDEHTKKQSEIFALIKKRHKQERRQYFLCCHFGAPLPT